MKAVTITGSGRPEFIKVVELPRPVPRAGEILVKVQCSSVTRGDVALRTIPKIVLVPLGLLFGFKPMSIPGVEYAGIVEEIGPGVVDFGVGDRVFGTCTGLAYGGNAEYVCVPVKPKMGVLATIPEGLSFEAAACLPVGAMTALFLLNKAGMGEGFKAGTKVLVYGASGSVGTFAVQIAKHFGAEVTGACSPQNVDLVKSLGADYVVDYSQTDWSRLGNFDVIFDAVGKLKGEAKKSLMGSQTKFVSVKSPTSEKVDALKTLGSLAAEGKIKVVIDQRYTLDQVRAAHEYVEGKRKKGNVSVTLG